MYNIYRCSKRTDRNNVWYEWAKDTDIQPRSHWEIGDIRYKGRNDWIDVSLVYSCNTFDEVHRKLDELR